MANIDSAVSSLKVNTDIWELMLAGVVKYYSERLLTPYIGNGTLMSGLVKLGIPLGAEFLLPASVRSSTFYKIPKTALVIDGAEDIVKFLMDKYVGNKSNETGNSGFSYI